MRKKASVFFGTMSLAFVLFVACSEQVKSTPSFLHKPAPKKGVVANINGSEVTEAELVKGIESEIYQAEMKLYDLKFAKLRAILLEKLMNSDPNKKGLTNDQFLEKYIVKGKKPTAKDVEAFIKERKIPKQHINDEFKKRVVTFLEGELKKKEIEKWIAAKTQKNPVEVYFPKPERPYFEVDPGTSPFIGGSDAKVTIVEFSDFQCPYCARAAKVVNQIKKKYGNKVKIVFKNFPLPFHNQAQKAAEAALCAGEQKKSAFWKLHDKMFENQSQLSVDGLKALAKEVGIKAGPFAKCLESGKFADSIRADKALGEKVGVKSTPTFFVNGRLISGAQPLSVFEEEINKHL